jgi:putative acetyltransferase
LASRHYAREELEAWAAGMRPEAIERALADPGKTLLVALADGEVAGFALFEPGEVLAMYVHPEHARQGLGGNLLARAETAARQAGCGTLRLTASRNAVAFYAANGFRGSGEDVFRLRGGLSLACLKMEKCLAPPAAARRLDPA